TDDPERGVLSTHLFADGRHAEKLWVDAPGLAHDPFISEQLIREGKHHAVMEGREVFKYASILMPQSVAAALEANHVTPGDVKLLVPHQANLRIIEMVQKAVGLRGGRDRSARGSRHTAAAGRRCAGAPRDTAVPPPRGRRGGAPAAPPA